MNFSQSVVCEVKACGVHGRVLTQWTKWYDFENHQGWGMGVSCRGEIYFGYEKFLVAVRSFCIYAQRIFGIDWGPLAQYSLVTQYEGTTLLRMLEQMTEAALILHDSRYSYNLLLLSSETVGIDISELYLYPFIGPVIMEIRQIPLKNKPYRWFCF